MFQARKKKSSDDLIGLKFIVKELAERTNKKLIFTIESKIHGGDLEIKWTSSDATRKSAYYTDDYIRIRLRNKEWAIVK